MAFERERGRTALSPRVAEGRDEPEPDHRGFGARRGVAIDAPQPGMDPDLGSVGRMAVCERAMSKAEIMRQHVLGLYRAHEADGMLPTSGRFLYYESVTAGVSSKQASGVLKPGAKGQAYRSGPARCADRAARERQDPMGRNCRRDPL